jgi:hypothetical protein
LEKLSCAFNLFYISDVLSKKAPRFHQKPIKNSISIQETSKPQVNKHPSKKFQSPDKKKPQNNHDKKQDLFIVFQITNNRIKKYCKKYHISLSFS